MSDRNIPSNERSLWDALLDAREYINSAYTLGSYAREIRRTALLKRIDALTDGTPPAVETTCFDGYKDAFYQIAELLDMEAMPISPKEAFETVMLPRLRERFAPKTSPEVPK